MPVHEDDHTPPLGPDDGFRGLRPSAPVTFGAAYDLTPFNRTPRDVGPAVRVSIPQGGSDYVAPEDTPETYLARKLQGTNDVQVWAEAFCAQFDGHLITNIPTDTRGLVDEGTMISWFANMAMADRAQQVTPERGDPATVRDGLGLIITALERVVRSMSYGDGAPTVGLITDILAQARTYMPEMAAEALLVVES